MWTLEEAVSVIRTIQDEIHELGYHVCLGGSVLNKGQSEKDVDLIFVPLTNEQRPELGVLCNWFNKKWGATGDNVTDPVPCISLRFQASYFLYGKRVDVFVV